MNPNPDPNIDGKPWRQTTALILGGARSGKSRHGERLCLDLAAAGSVPPVYIATAQAFDDEMRARIDDHRSRRGPEWATIDAPLDLPAAVAAQSNAVVLVDCLTLWLTNVILADRPVDTARADLLSTLATAAENGTSVILVANEVGLGLVPETPLGRRFRDEAGILNQAVASVADTVTFIAAGLPLSLKSA
ncbi:bifunctional adenosylcobinamide kinase/adenosylcobinamide-phosphate guanylyltransferase [Fodinicurvata sp. EGI_FJ10296]|uniref:bifunctional adenosylcobinamide kinase/adenosylcobinamide-phosphate guanylyltransferase n=1 Tax=Fodinicurvata sp. EGI_FJ10296 TaxID=3231908 RepID=UPI0034552CB0